MKVEGEDIDGKQVISIKNTWWSSHFMDEETGSQRGDIN